MRCVLLRLTARLQNTSSHHQFLAGKPPFFSRTLTHVLDIQHTKQNIMGDELTKKRKRRRRSKEKTDDDAAIKEVTPGPEAEGGNSGETAAENSDTDAKEGSLKNEGGKTENQDADDDANEAEDGTKTRKRKRKRKSKATAQPEDDKPSSDPDAPDATSRTVFIEGLPFTSSPSNVRYFFEQHGCSDIVEMRLPTWQDSGRLRGFGHVVFNSLETREKALSEVNGKELGGRYVTVQVANAPRAGTSAGEFIFFSGRGYLMRIIS